MALQDMYRPTATKVAGVGALGALGLAVALGAGPSASSLQHQTAGISTDQQRTNKALADKDGRRTNPELRAALEKARALSGDARREALQKVWSDVRAGKYGEQAQRGRRGNPELNAALEEARALSDAARREALKKIGTDVRAGKYGEQVQRKVLNRRAAHRAALRHLLPPELRTDLRELRKDDPAKQGAGRDAIKKKALAGDYGPRIEKLAKDWLG